MRHSLNPFGSRTQALSQKSLAGLFLGLLTLNSTAQVPDEDPVYSGPAVGLVGELVHPRLLFNAEEFAQIKAFHDSAEGAVYRNSLANNAAENLTYNLNSTVANSENLANDFGNNRLPTWAMHYALTGDPDSWDSAMEAMNFLLNLALWSGGDEPNCGMPAGNLLTGAALAYDILYNDLEPTFREEFRANLWYHARAMYHLGHLQKANNAHYWQQDPQNNHRFHRLGGLTLGVIAAYTGDSSEDWLLANTIDEIEFVTDYLPPDGSNHEGINYINYGIRQLLLSVLASDKNLGTNHLSKKYFKNVPLFIALSTAPGLDGRFIYADDSSPSFALGQNHFPGIIRNDLADVQSLLDTRGSAFSGQPWLNLIVNRSRPTGGSIDNLPRNARFPDLGVSFFREGWEKDDIAAMFKCGPFGGQRLNEYRNANNFHYINVAHDDPDANSFVIWKGEGFVVETDRYSYSKKSANHNTILVNGVGQRAVGKSEGAHWSQPAAGDVSMLDMAFITNWKNEGDIALVEGEAVGSYPGTGLTRFRRSFLWNSGKYILIFDDIRANSLNTDITWLIQSNSLGVINEAEGRFVNRFRGFENPFQIKSNLPYTYQTVYADTDDRGGQLWFRQLQVEFDNINNLQVASLHQLWDTSMSMTLNTQDSDHATITISGDGFEDVWTWTAATDNQEAGSFELTGTSQSFSSEKDPWLDEVPGFSYETGPWVISTWLGAYYPDHYPWLYSSRHGWLFNIAANDWYWNPEQGWLWTQQEYYPWFYQNSNSRWIYYVGGNHQDGLQWFSYMEGQETQYFSVGGNN